MSRWSKLLDIDIKYEGDIGWIRIKEHQLGIGITTTYMRVELNETS